jgi:hypothetical protein
MRWNNEMIRCFYCRLREAVFEVPAFQETIVTIDTLQVQRLIVPARRVQAGNAGAKKLMYIYNCISFSAFKKAHKT